MGLQIKIAGASFTNNIGNLGYPVLTGLTDLYEIGTNESISSNNKAPSGVAPTVLNGGVVTYASGYATFPAASRYETNTLDSTQDATLVVVFRATTGGALPIGNFRGTATNNFSLGRFTTGGSSISGFVGGVNANKSPYPAGSNFVFAAFRIQGTATRLFYGESGVLSSVAGAAVSGTRGFSANKFLVGSDGATTDFNRACDVSLGAIHKSALSNADITSIYNYVRNNGRVTVN